MCEKDLVKDSILEEIYLELRESEYPIYIWGAGSMSVEVENRLKEQQIEVKGFFVNEDKKKSHIIQKEDRIYALDKLEDEQSKINVVIGHGHFEKRKILEKYSFINKIYIIPNPYIQYCSKGMGKYVESHKPDIENIMVHLADKQSCDALQAYCKVNETDDIRYLMNKEFCIDGMFGFEGLKLTHSERYLDVGAWEGDTIELFLEKVSEQYRHIAAVEPDPNSFFVLKQKMKGKGDIEFYPYGVGKKEGILYLDRESTQSAYFSEEKDEHGEKIEVKVKTLDSLFVNEMFSLIKISIPFLFLDVLQGCEECIKKNKPRLVVNVAADDGVKVFDTINWIFGLKLDYKIALRFDFPMPTRLYLYAY
ncbi:FkbM family methyltransferase [Dorea sp. 5-2]|nr:FkbM family methyltransferase [Dorea sp. 5-2]